MLLPKHIFLTASQVLDSLDLFAGRDAALSTNSGPGPVPGRAGPRVPLRRKKEMQDSWGFN